MMTSPILVLGANGKTGRRVAQRLAAKGVPVRAGSRSASPPFDWDRPETWGPALQNVSTVYVTYQPDLAAPGAPQAIGAFTKLAASSGVKRLVLLSGRGEPEAQHCEQIVRDSGVEWTIVRASWFCQNFSESFFLGPLLAGELALPAGDVGEPFVDVDDIAEVVVAALTEDRHVGQLYEVTGARLWTFAQAAAEIARVTGRSIRYAQISHEEFAAGLQAAQVPSDVSALVVYLFKEVLDGRNASLADGIERALGRAPRDFSDYVRDTAATGVWNPKSA